jgi:hypothetical protein
LRALALTGALDRLAIFTRPIDKDDLTWIYRFLSGWPEVGDSSIDSMFAHQLSTVICPVLPGIIRSLHRDYSPTEKLATIGKSLLDICRPVIDFPSRLSCRHAFVQWLALTMPTLASGAPALSNPVDATEFFSTDHRLWPLGWGEDVPFDSRASLSERLLLEFISDRVGTVESASGVVWELFSKADAKALGRALGLAILNGADLRDLRLAASVARLLHPRMRLEESNLYIVRSRIAPMTTDSIVHIGFGLLSVLGPGGFEIFTNQEWMDIFNSPTPQGQTL